jgi:Rap1a immunity proteins
MRILLMFVLFSASLASARINTAAEAQEDTHGTGLLRACSLVLDVNVYHPRKIKHKLEAYDMGFCLGMIQGVYANVSGSYFCPTDGGHIEDVLKYLVKFIKHHPELEDKDSADIVRWSLSEEYPCSSGSESGGDQSGN